MNNILFKLYQKIAFLADAEKVHNISLPILEFIYKSYFGKVLHKKIINKKTKITELWGPGPHLGPQNLTILKLYLFFI